MTFWQLLWDHKVKIIGVILAVHSQLMIELAVWATDGLVSPITVRIVGSIGTLFAVASSAAGFSNSTKEKVAEARAEVATAMQDAINSTPGESKC